MLREKSFKRETTHNGTLKTFVTFRRMKVADSFYETEEVDAVAFSTWAEIYDVSIQDLDSLKGRFSKNALALESIKSKAVKTLLTLKIRDPMGEFQPRSSDTVVVNDSRFRDQSWEVIDYRPDFYNRRFLVIYLSGG